MCKYKYVPECIFHARQVNCEWLRAARLFAILWNRCGWIINCTSIWICSRSVRARPCHKPLAKCDRNLSTSHVIPSLRIMGHYACAKISLLAMAAAAEFWPRIMRNFPTGPTGAIFNFTCTFLYLHITNKNPLLGVAFIFEFLWWEVGHEEHSQKHHNFKGTKYNAPFGLFHLLP